MSEPELSFEEFQLHTEWVATGEGWVRNPIDGITIEILDYKNGTYQLVVDRHGVSVGCHRFPQEKCDSRERLMKYAWMWFQPFVNPTR